MENSNIFYIYEWFIIETNEVFYVGKGKDNRYKKTKRNKFFNRIYAKYNCDVRMVKDNLNEEEAFQEEINLIKYYKDNYPEYKLTNMTNGGEGVTGYKWSKELKLKISKGVKQYYKNHEGTNKNREFSEETKDKISISLKAYYKENNMSDETKEKLSNSLKEYYKENTVSDEARKKISESKIGKSRSEETKQKISKNHADCSGEKNGRFIKLTQEQEDNIVSLFKQGTSVNSICKQLNIGGRPIVRILKKYNLK